MIRRPRPASRGIALPAMVFVIVAVALMLGAGLVVLTQSQHAQVLQLQAARALAAARSGTEWGLWMVSDPEGSLGLPGDQLPPCFASRTLALPAPLQDLPVEVSCTREPATGSIDDGGLKLASYRVLAVVTSGDEAGNERVQRQVEARHTLCKNPGGTAPLYAC